MDRFNSPNLQRTTKLMGTTVLGALVVVFDYTLKFSGWKIPFPWFPSLKFDFTGIPIALSLLLYGLHSGAVTSAVAFLAIVFRSGDFVGASMKALAEFSTILGMAPFKDRNGRAGRVLSLTFGLFSRVVVTSLLNITMLPFFYPGTYTFLATVLLLPLVVVFNVLAGCISMFAGYFIYEAMARRALLKSSPTISRLSFETRTH